MAESPRCQVLYANQLVIDQRWSWRLSDPFWRLYFNRDPGATIGDDQQRWQIPPYRAVVVPPWGDFHGFCVAPVRHFYIHFETPGLPDDWIRRHWTAPVILDEDPVLRAMLDELAGETIPAYPSAPGTDGRWRIPDRSSTPGGVRWSLRLHSAAAWTLARALEHFGPQADVLNTTPQHADLEPALRWIDTHLADPLSVAGLAKRCQLSHDHFGKRFAAAIGRTPMRYVQERRIAAAADQLLHSADDIDTVALSVGFSNRFHFSRIFTKLLGTPPAQYRRQHLQTPPR